MVSRLDKPARLANHDGPEIRVFEATIYLSLAKFLMERGAAPEMAVFENERESRIAQDPIDSGRVPLIPVPSSINEYIELQFPMFSGMVPVIFWFPDRSRLNKDLGATLEGMAAASKVSWLCQQTKKSE
jgi:hypothetical protein